MPLGLGISCKAGLLCLNIFIGNLFFDVLIIGLLLIYGPGSWKSGIKPYSQNWKDLDSNPNLVTRVPVTLGSIKHQTQ